MLPVDEQQTYQGLIITRHHIVDSVSKDEAQKSISGWAFQAYTAPAWIRALENGHTIQPSLFLPKPDGSYTHNWQSGLWQSTNFICADGDHFLGVEKDDKGNEKHPNGIPPWTDKSVLGEKYPELKDDVYAVGESVSSMQTEPPHRRYRLIFLFDKPIKSVPSLQADSIYPCGKISFNICRQTFTRATRFRECEERLSRVLYF